MPTFCSLNPTIKSSVIITAEVKDGVLEVCDTRQVEEYKSLKLLSLAQIQSQRVQLFKTP